MWKVFFGCNLFFFSPSYFFVFALVKTLIYFCDVFSEIFSCRHSTRQICVNKVVACNKIGRFVCATHSKQGDEKNLLRSLSSKTSRGRDIRNVLTASFRLCFEADEFTFTCLYMRYRWEIRNRATQMRCRNWLAYRKKCEFCFWASCFVQCNIPNV